MSRLFKNLSSLAAFLMVLVCSLNVNAQEVKETNSEDAIFIFVEDQAEFPGGQDSLMKFLAANIKYSQAAKEKGTRGKVVITFIVEKDGSLSNIKVLRDIGDGCGEEAIRVVNLMPKWKPAKQREKNVRQQFVLPITFRLSEEEKVIENTEPIYTVAEEGAEFIGGVDKMMEFLAKNILYPQAAKENRTRGKVIISFIVEKDGSISDIRIIRSLGFGCDEEAVRVIKLMPKWKPAKQREKNVRYQYILPVRFNLTEE